MSVNKSELRASFSFSSTFSQHVMYPTTDSTIGGFVMTPIPPVYGMNITSDDDKAASDNPHMGSLCRNGARVAISKTQKGSLRHTTYKIVQKNNLLLVITIKPFTDHGLNIDIGLLKGIIYKACLP